MSFFIKSFVNNNITNISSVDNFDTELAKISAINKSPKLNLKLLSPKKNKFSNNFIFTKRDLAYNKSLEKNKNTFKYRKYNTYFQLEINQKNKNDRNKITKMKKNNSSNTPLYLTEYIYTNKSQTKFNNSSLHSFRKSRSHFYESDKSLYINSTNLENNSTRKNDNHVYNNYLSFCKGQIVPNKSAYLINSKNKKNKFSKKINLKLYNPRYALHKFEIEREKDKKKKLKIELEYKQLESKSQYLNNYRKKEMERHKYIDSFQDYFLEKINLDNTKEKRDVVKEENENKLCSINYAINQTKKSYEDFNEIFFVKFYDFFKRFTSQSENEKIKSNKYLECKCKLKKQINILTTEINKDRTNIEYINKFALLNAKLHLKKLSLPIYYEYIFENRKSELTKFNLSEQDIQNIIKYKKNLDLNEIISLIKKYENVDLNLLKECDYLSNDINVLIQRKKDIANDLLNKKNDITGLISSSEEELIKLKAKNQELMNRKNLLLSYYNINQISNNKKDSAKNKRKSSIIINFNQLYLKTINIFNNLSEYINHNFDYLKKPKLTDGLQAIIIYNFTKIEALTDILLDRINKFKQDNPNKARIFNNMMDKKRKMRNDIELRKNRELLDKLKKEKIEEKNKKIYTIKRTKIYNYNLLAKYKKRNKSKKITKADTIFDYLNS